MDQPNYRVLLEGHTVGPYDRRTIVGMRIKHALSSDHLLISSSGSQLTVGELIGQGPPAGRFPPNRGTGSSRVRATYPASLIDAEGAGLRIPRFRGEMEARVQADVLRIAGRYRRAFGWKEDRIKMVLADIVHARQQASRVGLWLRTGRRERLQRVALELFTDEAAAGLVGWLPNVVPLPEPEPGTANSPAAASPAASTAQALAIAVAGVAVVIGLMLLVLIYRRVY